MTSHSWPRKVYFSPLAARALTIRSWPEALDARDLSRACMMASSCDACPYVFAEEFRPFVDEWYEGSGGFVIEGGNVADVDTWQGFVSKYRGVRTLPVEALAAATAATNDKTLSIGLPEIKSKDNRANRLASMMRWLSRFHATPLTLFVDLQKKS